MIREMSTTKQKDRNWSSLVKDRDRFRCRFAMSGCMGEGHDPHHIFSRRFKELRWHVNNGLTACRNCHNWLEANSKEAEKICRKIVGEEIWAELTDILVKNYKLKR